MLLALQRRMYVYIIRSRIIVVHHRQCGFIETFYQSLAVPMVEIFTERQSFKFKKINKKCISF